jgi:hypothetical protein
METNQTTQKIEQSRSIAQSEASVSTGAVNDRLVRGAALQA